MMNNQVIFSLTLAIFFAGKQIDLFCSFCLQLFECDLVRVMIHEKCYIDR